MIFRQIALPRVLRLSISGSWLLLVHRKPSKVLGDAELGQDWRGLVNKLVFSLNCKERV